MTANATRRAHVATWALVLALLAAACSSGGSGGNAVNIPTATPAPAPMTAEETAEAFLAAWESEAWDELVGLAFGPTQLEVRRHRDVWDDLGVVRTAITVGDTVVEGPLATTTFVVRVSPEGMPVWEYESSLTSLDTGDGWFVDWTPAVIHPALREGRTMVRVEEAPQRGRILDHEGRPLRADRGAQEIGLVPGRLDEDRTDLLEALESELGLDPAAVEAAVDAPGVQPDWFVSVAVLDTADFDAAWPQLRPIPGVVFQTIDDRQSAAPDLATQVLGTTGPITAEQLASWGDPYMTGDIVGRSGMELVYEDELRGSVYSEIQVIELSGTILSTEHRNDAARPSDVETTLDLDIQRAAEAALSGTDLPAALVAIDIETGEIRAVVSTPTDGFNRALSGLYPPGSTFKTVVAAGALASGEDPDSSVSCPESFDAGGFSITNAGGSSLGEVTLQTAFAQSCNTAFAAVGVGLGTEAVTEAAGWFGFDVAYSVGLETGGGRYPTPVDDADLGSSSIGQGRVQASPVHMASVAAAVQRGQWIQPTLVRTGDEPVEAEPLPAGVADDLQAMMAAVVTQGTGGAAAAPGPTVFGKTGSAEFGEEDPPRTHAWFIGAQGDLAVAVLVEGGGGGGSVAAPLAGAFFNAVQGS